MTQQQTQTTDQLAATQYVVPVQSLQTLSKLAKANTPLPATAVQLTHWRSWLVWMAIWTAAIWMAFDLFYGGVDKRAVQAEAQQAKQQAAHLEQQNAQLQQGYMQQQQAINTAAAALGCPTGSNAQ